MAPDLITQVRAYAEQLDTAARPLEELLPELAIEKPAQPWTPEAPFGPRRGRVPRWVVGLAAAVVVVFVIGAVAALQLLGGQETPPATQVPTPTTTTPPDTTATTTPEPVGAAVIPPPYMQPRMVDVPGEGVLLEQSELWSFRPDTGWIPLDKPPHAPDTVWFWGYDPVSQLAWGDDLDTATEDSGMIGEMWTYAPASGEWAHVETIGAISTQEEIYGFTAVLDIESRQLIHVGGFAEGGTVETWALDLDAKEWTEMNPAAAPGARADFAMAYDRGSDRIIFFGGWENDDPTQESFDETWAYDFNSDTWTRMDPALSPRPSHGGRMTYDPVNERMILFGGTVTGLSLVEEGVPVVGKSIDDTWAYDFTSDTWTEIETSTSPSSRKTPGMAYDAETGLIVLFGGGRNGFIEPYTEYDDTWFFDPVAETWTEWVPPVQAVAEEGPVPAPDETTTTQAVVAGMTCAEAGFDNTASAADGEFTLSLTSTSQSWCVDVTNVALGDWTIDIDVDPNGTLDVLAIVLRDSFSPGDACAEVRPNTVTGQDNIYTLSGIDSLGPDLSGVNGCAGDDLGPQYGDDDPAFAFLVFARVGQDNSGTMTVTYPTLP